MARLIELNRRQNERDGTCYPLPRMFGNQGYFDSNIALALAIERAGRVTQGIYFQSRMVEMCLAGCDARSTLTLAQEAEAVKYTLRSLGVKGILSHVPKSSPPIIGNLLENDLGFKNLSRDFTTYFLDIEGAR